MLLLPRNTRLVLAFLTIYVVWGSTYLGIRFAVETIPPMMLTAIRASVAGVLLYIPARLLSGSSPSAIEWRNCFVVAFLMLVLAQGLIAWAEQYIPSSLTAVLITSFPFWYALLSWLLEREKSPSPLALLGVVIGFAGIALLVHPIDGLAELRSVSSGKAVLAAMTVPVATFFWASGSLYARHSQMPKSPILSASMQMLCAGICCLLFSSCSGDLYQVQAFHFSDVSLGALVYLIVAGSVIAFPVYNWLVPRSTPVLLSTFAYVNPIIAMVLGWTLGGEAITTDCVRCALITLGGVVLITIGERGQAAPSKTLAKSVS